MRSRSAKIGSRIAALDWAARTNYVISGFYAAVLVLGPADAFSVFEPHQACAAENPYYDISPTTLFPVKASLLPKGTTYSDTIPDTLDLATRAGWYVAGSIQTIIPSLHDSPAGTVLRPETTLYDCSRGGQSHSPCLIDSAPNWGKAMRGLTQAREMTAYDRDDTDFTLTTHHRMMTNMLDWDVTVDLLNRGYPGIVYPQAAITPQTVAMQSLVVEWKRNPSTELTKAVNEFVQMHRDLRTTIVDTKGNTFNGVFWTPVNPNKETHIGYLGDYWIPFVQGKALRVLSEWYLETGNLDALAMSNDLSHFLRNFENGGLWQSPDPVRFPPESGQFVGHIHSWLQAALGLATHAEALRKTNPQSGLAQAELQLADSVYNFVKRRTKAGKVGNFGESGSTGDMVALGIKLTEQGLAYYYDEVEAWTRNAITEMQIDPQAAQYIPNYVNPLYEHSLVGTKTTGMFFADGTHVARIPFHSAGGTADYPANTFAGMYEVWNKTVEYKGNFAQINFALNRASTYLDVKSDLPYRGEVEVNMKSDIGPLDAIGVRVPDWADQQAVSVVERTAGGAERTLDSDEWSWITGTRYVQVNGVEPDTTYIVKFPIVVYTETIYELRDGNHIWYEGSYPSPSAGSPETLISYQGTFRGNTLVDISPRPSGGFPRYQRQHLASLPPTDVAPPDVAVTRFVASLPLPGDYNDDGTVDAADYIVWREGGPLQNEGTSFGVVDQADYDVWRAHFGQTRITGLVAGGANSLTAVPEPSASVLLLLCYGAIWLWSSRGV